MASTHLLTYSLNRPGIPLTLIDNAAYKASSHFIVTETTSLKDNEVSRLLTLLQTLFVEDN